MLPQFFKASVVVIPDIAMGLTEFFCYFRERESLKEVQPQCFPLIFRQFLNNLLPPGPAKQALHGQVVFCYAAMLGAAYRPTVRDSGRIQPVGFHFPSSQKRLRVCDLN